MAQQVEGLPSSCRRVALDLDVRHRVGAHFPPLGLRQSGRALPQPQCLEQGLAHRCPSNHKQSRPLQREEAEDAQKKEGSGIPELVVPISCGCRKPSQPPAESTALNAWAHHSHFIFGPTRPYVFKISLCTRRGLRHFQNFLQSKQLPPGWDNAVKGLSSSL